MLYIMCGCIIFATHYLLKDNHWLLQKRLRDLIFGTILLISIAVIISTWIGSLLPVIVITLVGATVLQIKYTNQSVIRNMH
ncbi:hypothetical protein [Enterococcus termitis]|uniref:Uncharacterized protein n=1 Tax=Enterococcus termitis TaxID=332950 RepID=A0A1E5GCY8_9ENTE|nr:hypothetical protein [Enterococcus termitis]OEG10596.1 hypothetical protein BCR25_09010 [Enterococcus termitis]